MIKAFRVCLHHNTEAIFLGRKEKAPEPLITVNKVTQDPDDTNE